MTVVTDKIKAYLYLPSVPPPEVPEKPGILDMSVSDLSEDTVNEIANLRLEYNEQFETYRAKLQAYLMEILEGMREFRADAEEEFGLKDNPRAEKFYEKALEHTDNYADLYLFYQQYHDLIE